jgi:hypothetical protein
LAGIRAKQSNLYHLPNGLFQGYQWYRQKRGKKPVC